MEIMDILIQKVEKKPYYTVLDIGPGAGMIALKLSDSVFKIVAIDDSRTISERMSEEIHAKHIRNIQVIEKDIAGWKFLWPNTEPILTDCAFNSIICGFVLHHLKNKWKKIVLERLRESLTMDGQLIIVDVRPMRRGQIRRRAISLYRKLIRERGSRYPAWFAVKKVLSYLFFGRSLSANAWEKLLREAGYKNTKNEIFGDFILVWANN